MRVRAGTRFLPDWVMRIAYCVRAGEAATIQLLCAPEEYRFQTGFRLDAIALIPQQTEVDKCIGTRYTIT